MLQSAQVARERTAGVSGRLQNLGGELSLFSRKGEGVELIVEVPVA